MEYILLRDVKALAQMLDKLSEVTERERMLSQKGVAALRSAGVFRALVPRDYGGCECTQSQYYEVTTLIAQHCTSTAWVVGITGANCLALRWFPKEVQRAVWGPRPDVLIASAFMPGGNVSVVDGGYSLSGRWHFLSGIDHCAWALLRGNVCTEGQPRTHIFLVEAAYFKIIDDWFVAGLCGTGSKTLEVSDCFVPAAYALAIDETTASIATFRRLTLAAPFGAVAIGVAAGAIARFMATTKGRKDRAGSEALSRNPMARTRLAKSVVQVEACRSLYDRTMAETERASAKTALSDSELWRALYSHSFIVDSCSTAVLRLYRGSGGRSLFLSEPIQRMFRDVHAITQHAAHDMDFASNEYGRALMEQTEPLLEDIKAFR